MSAGISFAFNTAGADPDYLATVLGLVTNRTTRNGALTFSTAASGTLAERLRIDSSGNLGLGAAPTITGSNYRNIQIGGTQEFTIAAEQANSGRISLATLAYPYQNASSSSDMTNWKYAITFGPKNALYSLNDGKHEFFTAPNGTAGNVITWTQAMTLSSTADRGTLNINGNTEALFEFSHAGTRKSYLYQTGTELQIFNEANGIMAFGTNATERARITSGGNLLVGTTSNIVNDNARLAVVGIEGIRGQATGSGGTAAIGAFATSTGATYYFVGYDLTASAIKFQVLFNGNVQNTNNSYGAISDVKLKENIVDASPKLNDLMQVKVRNYNLKTEPTHKQIGVIAQELETIFPSMVEEALDYDLEGNNLSTTTKAVKYSVFVPMLIKAMQEQQVMINELMAKVATLESK
jgi:hypothetical protein